jgi:hypothetical protein
LIARERMGIIQFVMTEAVVIEAPFGGAHLSCECSSGWCNDTGFCEVAYGIMISINEELKNPGQSDLAHVLARRKCKHPQAIEMAEKGRKVLLKR